jgi:hypothetical protein
MKRFTFDIWVNTYYDKFYLWDERCPDELGSFIGCFSGLAAVLPDVWEHVDIEVGHSELERLRITCAPRNHRDAAEIRVWRWPADGASEADLDTCLESWVVYAYNPNDGRKQAVPPELVEGLREHFDVMKLPDASTTGEMAWLFLSCRAVK